MLESTQQDRTAAQRLRDVLQVRLTACHQSSTLIECGAFTIISSPMANARYCNRVLDLLPVATNGIAVIDRLLLADCGQ